MILPDGNCKKYIKVVIGIYIVFTIVSPVITKFTGKTIPVSETLELDKYIQDAQESASKGNSINNDNQNNIMNIYVSKLKDDIEAKLETKGYTANNIEIEITDEENYTINSIKMDVIKNENNEETEEGVKENIKNVENINTIEKVDISINSNSIENKTKEEVSESKDNISNKEKNELKEYLSGVYEVKEANITIN